MKIWMKALLVLATSAATVLGAAGVAQASTFDVLTAGQTMYTDDALVRATPVHNNIIALRMRWDGNLVLYKHSMSTDRETACWSSRTAGHYGARAKYQGDGSLVVLFGSTPLWSSPTQGRTVGTVDINAQGVLYVGNTPISGPCR